MRKPSIELERAKNNSENCIKSVGDSNPLSVKTFKVEELFSIIESFYIVELIIILNNFANLCRNIFRYSLFKRECIQEKMSYSKQFDDCAY